MSAQLPVDRREGVVYARGDCAGFFRRAVAGAIDAAVLLVFFFLLFNASLLLAFPPAAAGFSVTLGLYAFFFAYMVLLKRSRFRTLGYRVAGVRIVDLRGERPSIPAMIIRLLLLAVGPGFTLIDLVYLLSDTRRRKLSDTLAGTCVVRSASKPSGRGEVVPAIFFVLGHVYYHRELKPIPEAAA
jgi:uncharacterized RDD family membrane protein YckC